MTKQFNLGDLSQAELDARAANLVTPYGLGTRSQNRSAEKREMDAQRKAVTEKYAAGTHEPIYLKPTCSCAQRPYPHELVVHTRIRFEHVGAYRSLAGDGETLERFAGGEMRWPWSLRWAGEA